MAEIETSPLSTFAGLAIIPPLVNGLKSSDILTPTEIQKEVIPLALEGKDLIVVSETGTGKTLAYVLPILQQIDLSINNNQVIILAPTHELASQINGEINQLSKEAGLGIKSLLIIGSASMDRQKEALKKKPQIIVGSPGRIKDLMVQKKIKAHTIKAVIVDEADLLITTERAQTIRDIIASVPPTRQLLFVSATMCDPSKVFIHSIVPEIREILLNSSEVLSKDIRHFYIHIPDKRDKIILLRKVLYALQPDKILIFVRTNADVIELTKTMDHHHIKAAAIHGDTGKKERQAVINDFKKGKEKILVSSDLAARGLDVKKITHILNYNTPAASGDYKHRVGRTGRNGNKGIALTFTIESEELRIKQFEKELNISIIQKKLKNGVFVDR